MAKLPDNAHVLISGYTRSGKSRLAAHVARQWVSLGRRKAVVVIAPKYSGQDDPWLGWGVACHDMASMRDAWEYGHRVLRLALNRNVTDLLFAVRLANAIPHSTLVFDESHFLSQATYKPVIAALETRLYEGSVHGQSTIILHQYYAQAAPCIRSNCIAIISDPAEAASGDWASSRARVDVPALPRYSFVCAPLGSRATIVPPLTEAQLSPARVTTTTRGRITEV
jgi:hypothetical protein